ncbi:hypothetical protein ABT120_28805 [Nonomuraea angiospora]|uniref:hypothetical protein n=1 Tax=Nonomuraea angiospora TaxID=46172 RepID=UPI00331D300B
MAFRAVRAEWGALFAHLPDLGESFGPYDLRRTFASLLIRDGKNPIVIADSPRTPRAVTPCLPKPGVAPRWDCRSVSGPHRSAEPPHEFLADADSAAVILTAGARLRC